MCVDLKTRRFSQAITVALQGALSDSFAFPPSTTVPPWQVCDWVQTRGMTPAKPWGFHPWSWNRKHIGFGQAALQPPAIGHTCWVLVWPHYGPVQGDRLFKISSWVFAGCFPCCWSRHNLFFGRRKAHPEPAGSLWLHVLMPNADHAACTGQKSSFPSSVGNVPRVNLYLGWFVSPTDNLKCSNVQEKEVAFWLWHAMHRFEANGEGETLAACLESNVK